MSQPLQRAVILALSIQPNEEHTPFPSATSGMLFLSHVIFAAGLASGAMHVPSCKNKKSKLGKNSRDLHLETKILKEKSPFHERRINLHLYK